MTDQPRLILHVGAPKCGSSALQAALSATPVLKMPSGRRMTYLSARRGRRGNWSVLKGMPVQISARRAPHGYAVWPNPQDDESAAALRSLRDGVWAGGRKDLPILSHEGWIGLADSFAAQHPQWFDEPASGPVEIFASARPPIDWLNAAYWQWGVWTGLDFGRWLDRGGMPYTLGAALTRWAALPNTRVTLRITSDIVSAFAQHFGVPLQPPKAGNPTSPTALIGFLMRNRRYRKTVHDSGIEFVVQRWCEVPGDTKPWAILPRHLYRIGEALDADVAKLFALLPKDEGAAIRAADPRWVSDAPYHDRFIAGPTRLDDPEELAQLYIALGRGVAQAAEATGRPMPQLQPVLGTRASVHAWDVAVARALEHLIALDEAYRTGGLFRS